MKLNHLNYLTDPIKHQGFEIKIFKKENDEIIDGIIWNPNGWYPIVSGIPRILVDDQKIELLQRKRKFLGKYNKKLSKKIVSEWREAIKKIKNLSKFEEHQRKTADSFAFEWEKIYKENDYEKNNFYHFLSPYISEKDLKGKKTVDIGCGSGRFTKWAAKAGTEVSFGTDLGDSVEVAYKLNKNLPNVCIVQADIYHMPFKDVFDLAYSIGVLHHLPQPKNGFLSLIPVLNKTGRMLIWVYSRRNNFRALYFYEPMRAITRKMPKALLYKLCYIPALVIHLWNGITKSLKIKNAPFGYYENFPFNMKLNDAFDVLATPKSNYYYIEDIKSWFGSAKLKNIKAYEHKEAGITCIGNL